MARDRRPSGILSCEGHYIPKDTIVHCLTVWEHGHTRFCVQIAFLHFNFLVLTLKSWCYFVYDTFAIVQTPLSCNVWVLHRAVYRSWCINSHEPIHGNWGTRGGDCHSRFPRFTLVKAVFDALQPPTPASGEPAGKAKRPMTSSSTTLVVWQTWRNKSVLLFQLRSEHIEHRNAGHWLAEWVWPCSN